MPLPFLLLVYHCVLFIFVAATNLKQIASNFLTTLGRQERSAKANSFIFDELSTIVSTLDPELRSLISEYPFHFPFIPFFATPFP